MHKDTKRSVLKTSFLEQHLKRLCVYINTTRQLYSHFSTLHFYYLQPPQQHPVGAEGDAGAGADLAVSLHHVPHLKRERERKFSEMEGNKIDKVGTVYTVSGYGISVRQTN